MIARYRMFAGYNAWCNARLYAAAAALSDADYRANRGVFFKSLHGTLNHLLVGDRIWMRRFTGEGEVPPSLDAVLYDDSRSYARRGTPKMRVSATTSAACRKAISPRRSATEPLLIRKRS